MPEHPPPSAAQAYPRQHARTRGFTLGRPRGFQVAPDGSRVAFLRSLAGDDPVNRLWVLDLPSGQERLVVDPAALPGGGAEDLPPAERARRERARERAGGVVAYATDRAVRLAALALGGRLLVADLVDGEVWALRTAGPVVDPRPDPTGQRVAYVTGRELHVVNLRGGGGQRLAGEDDPDVTWGLPEFIAAEEMGRLRGYWWAPDGQQLAAARVDTRPVQRWHLADPANPGVRPATLAYPAAGTANADVRLWVLDLDGGRVEVRWDRAAFPYLVQVVWEPEGPLTLLVQSRDQTAALALAADPATGETRTLFEQHDPAWLEIVPGVPAFLPGGRPVWTADDRDADTRRLVVDGAPVTPPGLQVLAVRHTGEQGVLVEATEEPSEQHAWRVAPDGALTLLSPIPGVHGVAAAGGDVVVLTSATLERSGTRVAVLRAGEQVAEIASLAEAPVVTPAVALRPAGRRQLRTALLLPSGTRPPGPLPVLLDPYGGPHARRALAARDAHLTSQWFADQGFAVIVADGRGTPARGPAWEREIHLDLADKVLEDQVDALHAVAAAHPGLLDLGRVAIRGWSFGGYLAALAVLRRPEVFHAAVAGAPVTDWRLYDTHYTERYLGHPDRHPEAYARASLLADAAKLERPLLLIHGLADDNVVAAHTLRLSALLLAAGRAHSVLPLPGVTHMTPQEAVAENLLWVELTFLRAALGLPPAPRG